MTKSQWKPMKKKQTPVKAGELSMKSSEIMKKTIQKPVKTHQKQVKHRWRTTIKPHGKANKTSRTYSNSCYLFSRYQELKALPGISTSRNNQINNPRQQAGGRLTGDQTVKKETQKNGENWQTQKWVVILVLWCIMVPPKILLLLRISRDMFSKTWPERQPSQPLGKEVLSASSATRVTQGVKHSNNCRNRLQLESIKMSLQQYPTLLATHAQLSFP